MPSGAFQRIAKELFRKELSFDSPKSIADYYGDFRHAEQERMMILDADTKGGFLGEAVISIGTVNASQVFPRDFPESAGFSCGVRDYAPQSSQRGPDLCEEDLLDSRVSKRGK